MPRSGWLALGTLTAALADASGGGSLIAAGACAALATAAWLAWAGRREPAIRALAIALGIAAIGICLLAAGPAPVGPTPLPEGTGPWLATVAGRGTPKDGSQRFTADLAGPGIRVDVTAPRYPEIAPGDPIVISGAIEAPPDGPYGDYLSRSGIAGTVRASRIRRVDGPLDAGRLVATLRDGAGAALTRALPEPEAGLAAGILIGLRERVDRDLAAAFTATGLSHVVAISGWNIALVAGLATTLLAGTARRRRAIIVLVAVALYTIAAGASPSVLRAAVMAGIALVARELGRPGSAARALGWAVAILVAIAPASATDPGFQLSAAATAGLLAWASPLGRWAGQRFPHLPRWLVEGLAISLAAQAATLPISLAAFGRIAPLSPFLNLAVVPLVPLAMAAGAVALLGGGLVMVGLPAAIGAIVGLPGTIVLGLLVGIVRASAGLPLASVLLPAPAGTVLGALAALAILLVVLRGRRGSGRARRVPPAGRLQSTATRPSPQRGRAGTGPRRPVLRLGAGLLALALAALVLVAASRPDGRLHVIVLDVGQGDAILVRTPHDGRILVDAGPDPDRLLVALDARLPPWDRRIDLVILTHPHEDHVAGLPLLLERYRVGRVADPGMPGAGPGWAALLPALRQHGLARTLLVAGDRLQLDGLQLAVLWPDASRVPASSSPLGRTVNDASIVLLGTFGRRHVLLAADAEDDVDPELVARGLPALDLLKVAHHGSRTATSQPLLAALRPGIAVVSVGARNDYGHPASATLERIRAAGATVYRTDRNGAVDVALDDRGVDVRVDRGGPDTGTGVSSGAAGITASRTVAARSVPGVDPGPAGAPGPPGVGSPLPYDRADDRARADRIRPPAPVPRPARVAPAPLAGRRGDRRVARRAGQGRRRGTGQAPGGVRGPPPRRRQGPAGGNPGARAPPR